MIEKLLANTENNCSLLGKIWKDHPINTDNDNITFYTAFEDFIGE
jgi:hypothetical protein